MSAALQNADRGLRLTVGIWTRCVDELPDEETTVLVATDAGDVWLGFLDAGQWRQVSAEPFTERVTHWMDLPEAPNTEEDGQ